VRHNAIGLSVWRGSQLLAVASELSGSAALDGVEVIVEALDEPLSPPAPSAATCWTQACNEALGGVDMFAPEGGYVNCTQGFNVTRVINGVTNYMLLTAGHCGGKYSPSPEDFPCSVSDSSIKWTWMQDRASGTTPQTLGRVPRKRTAPALSDAARASRLPRPASPHWPDWQYFRKEGLGLRDVVPKLVRCCLVA
jgi:hypothetical protein